MSENLATRSTRTVTSADGTTIAVDRIGSGPALVLVDGAMCHREFGPSRSLAETLASSFTVYYYDRRGRGASSNVEPYSVAKEVNDLAAVIESAGGDAFAFGQSSGGALALEAAVAGVPIRKLGVYEAPYLGLSGTVDHAETLRNYLAAGKPESAVSHFLVKMVGAPAFVPVMMRFMPKVWKQMKQSAPTLPNDATILGDFTVPTERFSTIAVPTIVIGGSKGKANMKAAVQGVAAAIPGSRLKFLEGQTHQVSDASLAPELVAFFSA